MPSIRLPIALEASIRSRTGRAWVGHRGEAATVDLTVVVPTGLALAGILPLVNVSDQVEDPGFRLALWEASHRCGGSQTGCGWPIASSGIKHAIVDARRNPAVVGELDVDAVLDRRTV